MKDLLPKLRRIDQELTREKGELSLFGLFQREDGLGKWDLVVAAPWIDPDEMAALRIVAGKVQASLTVHELLEISRIVPLKASHPFVGVVRDLLSDTAGSTALGPFCFNGMEFVRGYVITGEPSRSGTMGPEKELIHRVREAGKMVAVERGSLSLLGLFQREEGIGLWDVIVAAPWISRDRTADIPYLVGKIQPRLDGLGMRYISRVVPLHASVPFVQTIQEMVGEVDGLKPIAALDFEGMELRRGYVLLSHPEAQPAPRREMAAT
jgi:hypothetical protein